jgi:hypothetical protein
VVHQRTPGRSLHFSNSQMEIAFGEEKKITEGRNRIRPSAGVRTACPDFHPSRMAAARAWGNLVAYFLQDSLTIFRSVTKSMLPPPACPPA